MSPTPVALYTVSSQTSQYFFFCKYFVEVVKDIKAVVKQLNGASSSTSVVYHVECNLFVLYTFMHSHNVLRLSSDVLEILYMLY